MAIRTMARHVAAGIGLLVLCYPVLATGHASATVSPVAPNAFQMGSPQADVGAQLAREAALYRLAVSLQGRLRGLTRFDPTAVGAPTPALTTSLHAAAVGPIASKLKQMQKRKAQGQAAVRGLRDAVSSGIQSARLDEAVQLLVLHNVVAPADSTGTYPVRGRSPALDVAAKQRAEQLVAYVRLALQRNPLRPAAGRTKRLPSDLAHARSAEESTVAVEVADFLFALRARTSSKWKADTYVGHDWVEFALDVWDLGTPEGGYFPRHRVREFLRALNELAVSGVGPHGPFAWAVVYNDPVIVAEVNRQYAAEGRDRIVTARCHGPRPGEGCMESCGNSHCTLHLHLNLRRVARYVADPARYQVVQPRLAELLKAKLAARLASGPDRAPGAAGGDTRRRAAGHQGRERARAPLSGGVRSGQAVRLRRLRSRRNTGVPVPRQARRRRRTQRLLPPPRPRPRLRGQRRPAGVPERPVAVGGDLRPLTAL